MSGKNRNRFESLLGVCANPVYKTSGASLPAKHAVTVGFSSGFNVKLPHDWSNFDLPKLMPVEHIFLVFRLERATEVLELTYLGKYFACVNAN